MMRRLCATIWGGALLFALSAQAAGDPRPCLGTCRLTFGQCYTSTRDPAQREQCLRAYSTCSKGCHAKAGTPPS